MVWIPAATEASVIIKLSHIHLSLSFFLSPAADAVPVRKDGDQVKCYYLFNAFTVSAHLNLFSRLAESHCD